MMKWNMAATMTPGMNRLVLPTSSIINPLKIKRGIEGSYQQRTTDSSYDYQSKLRNKEGSDRLLEQVHQVEGIS